MRHLSALLVLTAGCSFSAHGSSNPGGDDTPGIDAALPADASVDGAPACVSGFLDLCKQAAPSEALDITDAQSINTDMDLRCRTLTQPGNLDVCLLYMTGVHIAGTGSLTASGKRPLAIASSSTMTIDGTIDVGSHGGQRGPAADAAGCNFARSPDRDIGGGGGGAGGSFTLPGGDGGTGDQNNNAGQDGTALSGLHGTTTTVSVLRGGCIGQNGGDESGSGGSGNGGAGGHSGGALYLFAHQSLQIAGDIRATGAGGGGGQVQSGGGGGGTGGLVVIESPSLTISGRISANGGGGGQGGARLSTGGGQGGGAVDISGNPGGDGDLGATVAAGGSGAANNNPALGAGGAGGALTAAITGTTVASGGGGGGGAAGMIKLLGAQQQLSGSTISPAP